MEWILASLAAVIVALVCAVLLLAVRQRAVENRQRELIRHLCELQSEIATDRQQLESFQAAWKAAQANRGPHQTCDPLALIEQLSDVAALQDNQSLINAAHVVGLPAGVAADLFEADDKLLAISRLLDQGNSLSAIAARLNLPLGEVELLANTRP